MIFFTRITPTYNFSCRGSNSNNSSWWLYTRISI